MTGRLASGRVVLRVWVRRWLMLALRLPLLALAAAAFAPAASSINHQAGARPDERLLPPSPPAASLPARAIGTRLAVAGGAVSGGGEHELSRPRRAGQRWRVEP